VINLILLVFAFVCLALATFGVGHPRVNLLAGGLACWVLSLLTGR
jgi:hypothetical protein